MNKTIFKLKVPIKWKGIPCHEVSIKNGKVDEFHVVTSITNFWAGNYPDENQAAQKQIDS
jgi:hypothetical protein